MSYENLSDEDLRLLVEASTARIRDACDEPEGPWKGVTSEIRENLRRLEALCAESDRRVQAALAKARASKAACPKPAPEAETHPVDSVMTAVRKLSALGVPNISVRDINGVVVTASLRENDSFSCTFDAYASDYVLVARYLWRARESCASKEFEAMWECFAEPVQIDRRIYVDARLQRVHDRLEKHLGGQATREVSLEADGTGVRVRLDDVPGASFHVPFAEDSFERCAKWIESMRREHGEKP